MSFNRLTNHSQNYGNTKASGRNQIIANSRAKRQERQRKKKRETAILTIQKWFRMRVEYNQTMNECKEKFNTQIIAILKAQKTKSNDGSLNFVNVNDLLRLFRIGTIGFDHNANEWNIDKKYVSKQKKYEKGSKWFSMSIRRLYLIFSSITKMSTKSDHFISHIIDFAKRDSQMLRFKFLSFVLIKYLDNALKNEDMKEQQSVIMCLWSMYDCNKWKYFDSLSKLQQNECKIFCADLLSYVFTQTPFLSITSHIFTTYMKLPFQNNNVSKSKTILALLHAIIIRYFHFSQCESNQNEMKMDIDENESKDTHSRVITLICLHILSIPYYSKRLKEYKLESVARSFCSPNIWNRIIAHFEKYCMRTYDSFIFVDENSAFAQDALLTKIIPSSLTVSDLMSYPMAKDKKNKKNEVMDYDDYDDYTDSDDENDDENENKNALQTFMNMTKQQSNGMNLDNDNDEETYLNPNEDKASLHKRKRHKKKQRKNNQNNKITELPAAAWIIHNLLEFHIEQKVDLATSRETFISFLNISQTIFTLMEFTECYTVFPFDNLSCQYDVYYLQQFNQWCSVNLLSAISDLINDKEHSLSLDNYCIISKFLLKIIYYFPSSKEHHIWRNLNLNNKDENMIVSIFNNACSKYNMKQLAIQFLNAYVKLSLFGKKKKKKDDEYNASVRQLEEATNSMKIFELFLSGCSHQLRVIDDEQFKDKPFKPSVWTQLIESFKDLCFISYWSHYHELHKFQFRFRRNKRNYPLSPLSLLELYTNSFEDFMSSTISLFAQLRDRNTRKAFTNDKIWIMDKINLKQFEKEILNSTDDVKNDGDIQMQQQQPQPDNAFPAPHRQNDFNPFRNREFGYDEMYGGMMDDHEQNNNDDSSANLQRFEDNFNQKSGSSSSSSLKDNYRRSFLILLEIPFVIPFKLRVKLFYSLINLEKDRLESSGSSIRINRGNAIRAKIRRDNVLDDGYRGLMKFNNELKTLIQIEFESKHGQIEAGIDGGAIFKEFLNELIRDAFDPQRGLFLESSHDRKLYPNPNYAAIKKMMNISKNYYEFLGKMVGKALYDGILIEPVFAQFFLRKLLSKFNYVDDLQSYDADLYKQLMNLKHSKDLDIESMELSFCVNQNAFGKVQSIDLIPNGAEILVNDQNKHKYINILADYKLNKSMFDQSISFVRGLSAVVNLDYLRIFDAMELSKLLSGDTLTSDWTDLRNHTVYTGGFHNGHRCIKWFWEILNDDLENEDNQRLLMFVTSCTRAPLLGFKSLNPKFSIMCTGGDTTSLPTSQTCMNLLKMPNYKSKQVLKQKLIQSIRSNAGFDLS